MKIPAGFCNHSRYFYFTDYLCKNLNDFQRFLLRRNDRLCIRMKDKILADIQFYFFYKRTT